MYWPSVLSVIGYLAAIGTIDTGGTGNIHTIGAVYFFICLYFMVTNFTIISIKMHRWDARSMTRSSVIKKVVVAGYLSIVWIYCLIGLISEAVGPSNDDDIYIVIVEWNLVFAGLIWILCFLGDWQHIYLTLTPPNKIKPPGATTALQAQTLAIHQPYA